MSVIQPGELPKQIASKSTATPRKEGASPRVGVKLTGNNQSSEATPAQSVQPQPPPRPASAQLASSPRQDDEFHPYTEDELKAIYEKLDSNALSLVEKQDDANTSGKSEAVAKPVSIRPAQASPNVLVVTDASPRTMDASLSPPSPPPDEPITLQVSISSAPDDAANSTAEETPAGPVSASGSSSTADFAKRMMEIYNTRPNSASSPPSPSASSAMATAGSPTPQTPPSPSSVTQSAPVSPKAESSNEGSESAPSKRGSLGLQRRSTLQNSRKNSGKGPSELLVPQPPKAPRKYSVTTLFNKSSSPYASGGTPSPTGAASPRRSLTSSSPRKSSVIVTSGEAPAPSPVAATATEASA